MGQENVEAERDWTRRGTREEYKWGRYREYILIHLFGDFLVLEPALGNKEVGVWTEDGGVGVGNVGIDADN